MTDEIINLMDDLSCFDLDFQTEFLSMMLEAMEPDEDEPT